MAFVAKTLATPLPQVLVMKAGEFEVWHDTARELLAATSSRGE